MGIREKINENRRVAVGVAVAVVAMTVTVLLWQFSHGDSRSSGGGKAFFTIDDGATWFLDNSDKIPPFEHNGKIAYGAVVVTCDGGKTKWVAYLRRFRRPDQNQGSNLPSGAPNELLGEPGLIEIKKPGADVGINVAGGESHGDPSSRLPAWNEPSGG